jgi:hypothetical protein
MAMPTKMTASEIPSFIVSHFIEPYANQCYLVSIEYHYVNLSKLLVLLYKDCDHVNGSVHINLNNVVNNLMQRYEIILANPDWVIQETLFLINRVLQSYFYHKTELNLAPPKR